MEFAQGNNPPITHLHMHTLPFFLWSLSILCISRRIMHKSKKKILKILAYQIWKEM